MVAALGRRSFAEVCEKDAGLSAVVAERLIAVVRSMTPEQALAMGQKKAMAMIDLAAATPDQDTAAGRARHRRRDETRPRVRPTLRAHFRLADRHALKQAIGR